MAEFDIQSYLADMRKEQNEHNTGITEKIDSVILRHADLDKRLTVVEQFNKNIRWFVATVIVGSVTAMIDYVKNHLSS